MATGVAIPAPWILAAGHSISTDLTAAMLAPVGSRAFHSVGMAVGARQAVADPRPVALQLTGAIAPVHGLTVLGHIHVIPRQHDLGAVVSEQEAEVEVWNADTERGYTLQEITVDGPAGIQVHDDLGQPAHLRAAASHIYQIKVLGDGDALIDNLVTWVFAGVDPSGTNLRLTGFRLIPFPFAPNWAEPLTESFGFLTDIITSYRGLEQRVQLRAIPVGAIHYATLLDDLRDVQMAAAILFGNQARAFGVGRWQFQTRLLQDASAGDHDLLCDTANIPFEPGGMVLLWAGPFQWEVQTILSVLPGRLVLNFGLRESWPTGGTMVLPLVIGRLTGDEGFTWQTLAIGSTQLTFDIDGFRP